MGALIGSFCQCSNDLKRYLWRFLNDNTNYSHPPKMAHLVLQNLGKTFKYGGRIDLPGANEMKAFCENRTSKRQLFILPGHVIKTVKVFTATMVSEAVVSLAAQIGIHDPDIAQQFGIGVLVKSKLSPGGEFLSPLHENTYLMDAITDLEAPTKQNREFSLLFVRLFWTVPLVKFPSNSVHTLYSQIKTSFQEAILVSVNSERPLLRDKMDLISKLLAIDMRLNDSELKPSQIDTKIILEYLPHFMKTVFYKREFHEKEWANQVEKHLKLAQKLSPEQSQRLFVESVSSLPLFGAAVYPARPTEERKVSFIAVSKAGISLLNRVQDLPVSIIPLENISSIKSVKPSPAEQCVIVSHGNIMRPRTERIPTQYSEEVVNFVLGYQHRLGLTLKNQHRS